MKPIGRLLLIGLVTVAAAFVIGGLAGFLLERVFLEGEPAGGRFFVIGGVLAALAAVAVFGVWFLRVVLLTTGRLLTTSAADSLHREAPGHLPVPSGPAARTPPQPAYCWACGRPLSGLDRCPACGRGPLSAPEGSPGQPQVPG